MDGLERCSRAPTRAVTPPRDFPAYSSEILTDKTIDGLVPGRRAPAQRSSEDQPRWQLLHRRASSSHRSALASVSRRARDCSSATRVATMTLKVGADPVTGATQRVDCNLCHYASGQALPAFTFRVLAPIARRVLRTSNRYAVPSAWCSGYESATVGNTVTAAYPCDKLLRCAAALHSRREKSCLSFVFYGPARAGKRQR